MFERWCRRTLIALGLCGTLLLIFYFVQHAQPVRVAPVSKPPAVPSNPTIARQEFPAGGAWSSARREHAGYFNAAAAQAFEASVEAKLRPYIVHLKSRSFLPVNAPDAAAFEQVLPAGAATTSAILQFLEQPTDAQRAQLRAAGVEVLNYLADYGWVARGTPAAFENVSHLPNVRAIAAFDPEDKLHEAVFAENVPGYAASADGARLTVMTLPGTDAAALQADLAARPELANVNVARTLLPCPFGPRFEVTLPLAQVRALASIPRVSFIEFAEPPVANRDATTDSSSNITAVRDSGPRVDGTNVSVCVREIGMPQPHVDFSARLTYIDSDGDTANSGNVDHATAVVGQVASNGVVQPAAKGVAPNVSVLVYSLKDGSFSTHDIVDAAGRNARINNHSYGPVGLTTFGDYQTVSAMWDDALRTSNALGFFAGNEVSSDNGIDFFVGMKNGLCIEATSGSASAGNQTSVPPVAAQPGLASFAKHGPMADGRVKPDLVAFGEFVSLDQGLNSVTTISGTSFSTPASAGVTALVFQHYKDVVGADLSAALGKALLCASASNPIAVGGVDATYGFGIVNAQEAVRIIDLKTSATQTPFAEGSLAQGGTQTFTISVPQNAPLLKATLCWMDPAGNPSASKALVNDLDLVLKDPNNGVHFAFSLNASNPLAAATATGPNTVDPIELVGVQNPMPGVWTAVVTGTNVPQGPQPYAFCANLPPGFAPLNAVAEASPTSGPGPLTVSLSASASTGNIVSYNWTFFAEHQSGVTQAGTDSGVNVTHVFDLFPPPESPPSKYLAVLTVQDISGLAKSDSVEITVGLPQLSAYPLAVSAKTDLKAGDTSQFSVSVIARDWILTPGQASTAVKNGTFEGKKFIVRLGPLQGGNDALIEVPNSTFLLDRRASQKTKAASFAINLKTGVMTATFKEDLSALFTALGINSTTPASMIGLHVQLETDNAVYDAYFQGPNGEPVVLYSPGSRTGKLKYKN